MATTMPEMPDFLRRKPPTAGEKQRSHERRERRKAEHPGARLKMPVYTRVDPRKAIRAEAKRTSLLNRAAPVKGAKHPSTEAIKAHTANLTGDDKRAALYAVARENGIDPHRWDELNNGQVAMNLSNTLRGRYYKNEVVIVGGEEIE